jgi:hypothetical protein
VVFGRDGSAFPIETRPSPLLPHKLGPYYRNIIHQSVGGRDSRGFPRSTSPPPVLAPMIDASERMTDFIRQDRSALFNLKDAGLKKE